MRQNWQVFPDDADVGALAAEATLVLRPWDHWTADGKPQPGTGEVLEILKAVLAKSPGHPSPCTCSFTLSKAHRIQNGEMPRQTDCAMRRQA